ncbi:MAG: RNA polymerase subunit sigma [Acidobacteria bacterium]|nr:MAG: RNA polymerase subunit sigma [Acidobacteriota bacterium]REJ97955.1 MAG: RNA polymerase subunit sigma [Acidobacteriota bacterium]REK16698.1 MAG: RNA polymerase subunit sigma [Acidobacteriota bacterium]REK42609.1 MAG: RNA polymerase subunit sigma [Acidobacteriota bacterium]
MLENTVKSIEKRQTAPREDAGRLLDEHGDYLFRYALSRVGNESVAEDLVQETLLASLKGAKRSGGSSERTWLTAILKHKVIDHYRKAMREVQFDNEREDPGFFDDDGHWTDDHAPRSWDPGPADDLERKEFRRALSRSLALLPPKSAAVFVLSEIEGLPSKEICSVLNISSSNFWVTMHRARLQLRHLLEKNWFEPKHQKTIH